MRRIVGGLALVAAVAMAPAAWAGQYNELTNDPTNGPTVLVLPSSLVDSDNAAGSDMEDIIAAGYRIIVDIDNPDTDILSPYGNMSYFAADVTNSITSTGAMTGISTVQQTAGASSATSNLTLVIDGLALEPLIRELFAPDDTLLETEGTSSLEDDHLNGVTVSGGITTAGGKSIVGGVTHDLISNTTLFDVLAAIGTAGLYVEIENPVTSILSPHSNFADMQGASNSITTTGDMTGVSTVQQQAGASNAQSNLTAIIYVPVPALGVSDDGFNWHPN